MINETEYKLLREEIHIHTNSRIRIIIFSCIVSTSILTVLMQIDVNEPFMFLMPLVILGWSLSELGSIRHTVLRIVSYIIAFNDGKPDNYNWEKLLQEFRQKRYENAKIYPKIYQLVLREGWITVLGLLCIGVSFRYTSTMDNISYVLGRQVFLVILALSWVVFIYTYLKKIDDIESGKNTYHSTWQEVKKGTR